MRIVHIPLALEAQSQQVNPSNPFAELNKISNLNSTIISPFTISNDETQNNNNILNNSNSVTNLNGNTPQIVKKLSSIYGHVDVNNSTYSGPNEIVINENTNTNNTSSINPFNNTCNPFDSNTNDFILKDLDINSTCAFEEVNNGVENILEASPQLNDESEHYENSLVNNENNQKTILNNLDRSKENYSKKEYTNVSKSSSSTKINANLTKNDDEKLFLENLNVLLPKEGIESPSSIDDFNIKAITGFSKFKSLQCYSDSSSQFSSDEEVDSDEIDDEDGDTESDYESDCENKNDDKNVKNAAYDKNCKILNNENINVEFKNECEDDSLIFKTSLSQNTNSLNKLLQQSNQNCVKNDFLKDENNLDKTSSESFSANCGKMGGNNEINAQNHIECDELSDTDSVEMKSIQDENLAVELYEYDRDNINDKIDIKNKNFMEVDENSADNEKLEERHSAEGDCASSDNTISDKSFSEVNDDKEKGKIYNITSSSISFASANSSLNSTEYPRGIINPNYPGFQHLAHTLSEHFVNHPNDQDDSDLSEFEVELSVDDDIEYQKEKLQYIDPNQQMVSEDKKENEIKTLSATSTPTKLKKENSNDNLFEGCGKMNDIREHKEVLLPEIRISFECHDLKMEERFDFKDSPKRLILALQPDKVLKTNKNNKTNNEIISNNTSSQNTKVIQDDGKYVEEISCDLNTYLQKFETSTDLKMKPKNHSMIFESDPLVHQNKFSKNIDDKIYADMEKSKVHEPKILKNTVDDGRNCPTPDILMKNSKTDYKRNKFSSENRPDLLRNVSPQLIGDKCNDLVKDTNETNDNEKRNFNNMNENSTSKVFENISKNGENLVEKYQNKPLKVIIPENIPLETHRIENKDDHSFGTTPVDIVGDFGREVEREFGLLVTGYNTTILNRASSKDISTIENNKTPSPAQIENHEKNFMQKMTDAHLSDAKEIISSSSINIGNNLSNVKTSMVANIVVAQASLNHAGIYLTQNKNQPSVTIQKQLPCDLVLETNNCLTSKYAATIDKNTTKTVTQIQQGELQEQKVVEEKFLPSLSVSTTSNKEKTIKKIPPPPPPRRFLQQQLQQMQKRQQELQQLKQQQQHQLQQQQQQKQQQQQQHQKEKALILNQHEKTFNKIDENLSENKNLLDNTVEMTIRNQNTCCDNCKNDKFDSFDQNSIGNDKNKIKNSVKTNMQNLKINKTENSKQQYQEEVNEVSTIISKPKYNKFSYDDRELPPIGIGIYEQNSLAWYEKQQHKYEKNNSTPIKNFSSSGNNTDCEYNNVGDMQTKIRKNHSNINLSSHRTDKNVTNIGKVSGKKSKNFSNSSNLNTKSSNKHYVEISRSPINQNKRYSPRQSNQNHIDINSGQSKYNSNKDNLTNLTPRKKEKKIQYEDEFIRHDIYNSLKRSYEKQYNNNGLCDMNVCNGVGYIGSGYLIDNSYERTQKYILNLSNQNYKKNYDNTMIEHAVNISDEHITQNSQPFGKYSSLNQTNFNVYNIRTSLPASNMNVIESHLQKTKEEERKRRNDREEIRRRLAMGAEDDYFSRIGNNSSSDRPGRKPSLQSRLQNGNNLQICFMNEVSSDTESISSDSETCPKLSKSTSNASSRYSSMSSIATSHPYNSRPLSVNIKNNNTDMTSGKLHNSDSRRTLSQRPSTLSLGPPISEENPESDFFTKQARLQIEARMALAQAKDMAHMQMEIERQKQKESPITELIRNAMEKVGVNFPNEKRRISRQMCTDMNIAQLQIIVNDLHSQIENLNENLVHYLMERDELHMTQDSMLVDIEDLTRYLSAKEQALISENSGRKKSLDYDERQQETNNNGNSKKTSQMQSKFQRIASLVKK